MGKCGGRLQCLLLLTVFLVPNAGYAQDGARHDAALFDAPLAVQRVKPKQIDDPSINIYDADIIVDDRGAQALISHGDVGCDAMP
jgi:hypothetical protein